MFYLLSTIYNHPCDSKPCKEDETCCYTEDKLGGCCKLKNAECCGDFKTCCPEFYTCDLARSTCVFGTHNKQLLNLITKKE
jgi:hypothetical protein